ncbi:MAG: gliding motility-associated C-terminal domain-containing protein [Flavobacteriales bacterium]
MFKRYTYFLSCLFLIVASNTFGQPVITLNQPESENQTHLATEKIYLLPGYSYVPSGSEKMKAIITDYSIIINTIPLNTSYSYNLNFQGVNFDFFTGKEEMVATEYIDTTLTAKITVEATDSVGALTLLFDVNEVQITNVRVITDSLGSGDTLALDSNLYKISNSGQTLTLYQRDTNEVDADSLLYGLVLQGGLGFSPDDDDNYDELAISGLENINQFELTIKDLSDNIVFTTTDKSEFWNGKYMGSGSLVAVGAYKYILEVNGDTLEGQILLDY